MRAEVLQRRGISPAAPRLPIFAPCEAGGLGHEHTYQIAASAFVDQVDRMLSSSAGAPARDVAAGHIAAGCWRLGCRTHPLEWRPTHLAEELREDDLVEAWLLYRLRTGVGSVLTAGDMQGTALAKERWQSYARGPPIWEGPRACAFDREMANLGIAYWCDVTDEHTGEWLDWLAVRDRYGACEANRFR